MPPITFNHPKYDAAENTFLRRALEHVRARSYDYVFPEFIGRKLLPVDNSVPTGAETTSFDTYREVGVAEISEDYANDGPAVDTLASSQAQKIFGILAHYSYTLQDVRAGMMAGGKTLPERKAKAARRAVEQQQDRIMLLGDANWGLKGLFDLAGTLTYTTGGGAMETLTPDAAAAELSAIVHKMLLDTKEVEIPDTMVLPSSMYNYLNETRMGDGSDKMILKFFQENNDHIKTIEKSNKLESGTWTGRRIVTYRRDEEKLQAVIPQEFEQLPPDVAGLRTKTVCHARAAGVELHYPKSVIYADQL